MISSQVSIGDVMTASQYNNLRFDTLVNGGQTLTTGGSANTYTLSADSQYTAYAAGDTFKIKMNATNTGASTINVNSLGAKNIYKNASSALSSGDLIDDAVYFIVYDGTQFQLLNVPSISPPPSSIPWDLTGMASQDSNFSCTDNMKFIPFVPATGSLALHSGGIGPNAVRWFNGSQQQVARTTVWASAGTSYRGAVVNNGVLYWLLVDGSSNYQLHFCATNVHIGTGGNWAQITLVGTNLATTNSKRLIGYNGSAFIFEDDTAGLFIVATLSGTTLTEQSTFTATGANYGFAATALPDGVWFGSSSNPKLRFVDYTGTLDTAKQAATKSSTSLISVEGAAYADLLAVGTFNQYGNNYSILP